MKYPMEYYPTKKELTFQPIIRPSSFSLILGGMMCPCGIVSPSLEQLAQSLEGKVKVFKLNVDQIKKLELKQFTLIFISNYLKQAMNSPELLDFEKILLFYSYFKKFVFDLTYS